MNHSHTQFHWFVFYNDQLLLRKENDRFDIPYGEQPPVETVSRLKVEMPDKSVIMAARVDEPFPESETYIPIGLRASWDYLDDHIYQKASKAYQIVYWDLNSQYCPACGNKTIQTTPITKQCPVCKKEIYPPISTAILVLVRKGDSILLVRAHNFKGTFHSLVAGFLETGETLEECVAREVKEETGLDIENITYYGNQPWPYPSGLMVGFIADYAGGEIQLQQEELRSGMFYSRDHLPELPRKLSLARKMIDWWLEQQ